MELPEHKDQDYLGNKDVCEICPVCGEPTQTLGLNNWLQTYEVCHCTKTEKGTEGHWVRVTWHRKCYIENYGGHL